MKYTVEEVRARFEAWLIREHEYAPEDLIWQEKRNCYADYATHLAWNAYRDAYADLLERIKADEGAVTDAVVQRAEQAFWPAYSECKRVHEAQKDAHATGMRSALLAVWPNPPAQATQVGPAAKPHTLADFVHAPDAERVQIGQQIAARVDEMMAEPVAQPADSGRAAVGMAGTMPGTDGFTMALFKASDVPVGTELYTAPPAQTAERVPEGLPYPKLGPEQEACDGYVYECGYTDGWNACRDAMLASPAQPAQSVNVAKVREVIAHLRSFRSNTPPTWAHLDDAADKLEVAIKGVE